MKINFRVHFFLALVTVAVTGCSDDKKSTPAQVSAPVPQKPAVMEPFRFHKMIEVSPGEDYDILSWGRGSTITGAFEILHSDSAGAKYVTTTGDLDGSIVDVYNSDMDLDGNPEILIQTKGKDSTNYATVYAFEYDNNKANKLDFPRLTQTQRKGYRGNDNFYIKDGKLMREFPIYSGSGKDAKETGAKRQLQYSMRNNELTATQLSKDSTDVKTTAPAPKPAEKTTGKTAEKTTEKKGSTTTKKKHKEETPKKKHKKHHHSEE